MSKYFMIISVTSTVVYQAFNQEATVYISELIVVISVRKKNISDEI